MADDNFLHNMGKRKTMPHTLVLEHVSPATRLLEKRRQMFEVQESLEQQKQEFFRKEEVFKRREEVLKKKDLELQESLIRFSKFLQENDSKRTRCGASSWSLRGMPSTRGNGGSTCAQRQR